MIVPPPDVRAIVDKTAQFVGKYGPEFEQRILASEKNNVKFNFLITDDPYHAYGRQKVEEAKAQAADGISSGVVQTDPCCDKGEHWCRQTSSFRTTKE